MGEVVIAMPRPIPYFDHGHIEQLGTDRRELGTGRALLI